MEDVFSKEEERAEIGQTATYPIEYTSLPNDMHQFLQNIPHMTDLDEVYRYLEEGQFSDPVTQATLVYLKFCLQHAILLFNANYFPINDRTERDLCANVWYMIGRAFGRSVLTFEIEKSSNASREVNSKKKKNCCKQSDGETAKCSRSRHENLVYQTRICNNWSSKEQRRHKANKWRWKKVSGANGKDFRPTAWNLSKWTTNDKSPWLFVVRIKLHSFGIIWPKRLYQTFQERRYDAASRVLSRLQDKNV